MPCGGARCLGRTHALFGGFRQIIFTNSKHINGLNPKSFPSLVASQHKTFSNACGSATLRGMTTVTLTARDGAQIPAYIAQPAQPQAALIILHEAFAVTPHICRVADGYAREGFVCIAPDLFARQRAEEVAELGQENTLWERIGEMPSLPISNDGLQLARHYINNVTRASNVQDIDLARAWLKANHPGLPVAVIGYCFGGSMAYNTAAHRHGEYAACVAYYGGMLAEAASEAQPDCPTMIHLAEDDRYIPLRETVSALRNLHPAARVIVHAADHGFNRDDGVTYDPAVAAEAKGQTLHFLREYFVKENLAKEGHIR